MELTITLPTFLAERMTFRLAQALKAAGFIEAVRVPGPDVQVFSKDEEIVSLRWREERDGQTTLWLDSKTSDVQGFLLEAARQVVLNTTRSVFGVLPEADRNALVRDLDGVMKEHLQDNSDA